MNSREANVAFILRVLSQGAEMQVTCFGPKFACTRIPVLLWGENHNLRRRMTRNELVQPVAKRIRLSQAVGVEDHFNVGAFEIAKHSRVAGNQPAGYLQGSRNLARVAAVHTKREDHEVRDTNP